MDKIPHAGNGDGIGGGHDLVDDGVEVVGVLLEQVVEQVFESLVALKLVDLCD